MSPFLCPSNTFLVSSDTPAARNVTQCSSVSLWSSSYIDTASASLKPLPPVRSLYRVYGGWRLPCSDPTQTCMRTVYSRALKWPRSDWRQAQALDDIHAIPASAKARRITPICFFNSINDAAKRITANLSNIIIILDWVVQIH